MAKMKQSRDAEVSMWQSAVDEVVSKSKAHGSALDVNSPAAVSRPNPGDPMVSGAAVLDPSVADSSASPRTGAPGPAEGVVDTAKFCSGTAYRLAKAKLTGNTAEAARLYDELTVPMGPCDPKWVDVVGIYLANKALCREIPYRRYSRLDDFVINGVLQDKMRVALLADWGTGDQGAKLLLRQIAQKQPDVVIHLGDVYYSGTAFEYQNYFYKIWQPTFGLEKVDWGGKPAKPPKPATFTLPGNHDMYSGGGPYYTTIDMLGQPSSYFCLRNDNWQFIAIDTGLHDSDPVCQTATFLDDQEVIWLKDKIANSGGRKTVLLSHHQLFSAFETIGQNGNHINQKLADQIGDILPQVAVWFWGHEHNLVIYDKFLNVLARCIGHGAFPVDVDEKVSRNASIPVSQVTVAVGSDGAQYQHGYVIMDLAGASAKATYYQFDAGTQEETEAFSESIPAA
jgi:3',5'-cyclic AMP phosphodiesterase CpdA